ncbi:MAG: hypothetical protein AAF623_00395 [Planctomycetota bacterium]
MKQILKLSLFSLGLMVVVAMTGCEEAKKAADGMKDKAGELADGVKDKVGEMANVDFGSFDMKGLQEKLDGIKTGFQDVTAENVDGLTSKISGLTSSFGDLGIDKLPGPAKTAVMAAVNKFKEAIAKAMEGISDDSLLAKLKPVVESLMEKVNSMSGE